MVSGLFELINDPQLVGQDDPEERFTRSEVSWQQYEAVQTPGLHGGLD